MPSNGGGSRIPLPGRFVIPGVLILLGGLILLGNMGYLGDVDWTYWAKRLWPVVLILVGIDLLVDKLRR